METRDKQTEDGVVDQPVKEEKPSRWWLIDMWGGACLKVYFDISGLQRLLLRTFGGSDPGSYAGLAGIITVGAFLLGYYLSRSLVKVIDGSAMSEKGKRNFKLTLPIVYVVVPFLLALITAN